MKKAIILLLAVVAAMNVAATDRLYMKDFVIHPGEAMQVALILENDQQYTAFQTDLVLPEGISVVQEDDEYLFDLSKRKASDHVIISKLRDDGAIRMVSFSIGVKPYSGNSGALVVIPMTATDDFAGPATIALKHSRVVTLDGEEFRLNSESCEVQLLDQLLLGDINGDGMVNISDVTSLINYLLAGCQTSFHIANADMNNDGSITINDVTALINHLLQGS